MEFEQSVWFIGIVSLIAGVMIGALAYRYFAPSVKKAGEVKSELDSAREELESYKAGVTQHFDKTAELVNDLAQNYVKVYQHLADGAQTLGASKSFKDLMEQHQGKAAIAVDDPSKDTEMVDDGLTAEPVLEEEEVLETPVDYAEPSTETSFDGNNPEKSENETAETDVSEPVDDAETKDKVENVKDENIRRN